VLRADHASVRSCAIKSVGHSDTTIVASEKPGGRVRGDGADM